MRPLLPRRVLLVALSLAAAPAAAQLVVPALTPEQAHEANEAMARLKSPYTASHTVDMCPSAAALRDTIRVAAAGGMTAEQLVDDVVARHGERIRILPKRSGAGLLAWAATPLVILGGGALVYRRFRGSITRGPAPAAPRTELSAEDRARLDDALREMETAGEVDP